MIPASIKNRFTIFSHHPDLVYLDSAATTLKPQSVIDAVTAYYERYSANVGRGLYPLAEEASVRFEAVREKVAAFIGADQDEIIFTHGATDGINLLASVLADRISPVIESESKQSSQNEIAASKTPRDGRKNIVVTEMEHHSNFLPWKRAAQEHGVEFRTMPVNEEGEIDSDSLESVIDSDTAIVSLSAISNVLGTKVPVSDIVRKIKSISPNAVVVVDASQAAGHTGIDVSAWGADFVVFSGHKMFGPTGVGVLWGRRELLADLPPYQLGGGMVSDACAPIPIWKDAPHRFESGTPDIAAIIGLGAAVDFIREVGIENIRMHETGLIRYALSSLSETFGDDIAIFGSKDPARHAGPISFSLAGTHPHDLAQILGERGVCIRAGEHCAAPIHRKLGITATARISFSVYNDERDIDALIEAMKNALNTFK